LTEIYQGVDCTRRLKRPRYKLRLEKRRIYAEPGELLWLRLLDVPAECSKSCYTWRHVRGGGYLHDDTGGGVSFSAPLDNEGCKGSAVIDVYYGKEHLDTAFISNSTFVTPPDVLTWYRKNRTNPTPALDYWKYRSYVIKSMTLRWATLVDRPGQEDPFFTEEPLLQEPFIKDYYTKYEVATGDPLPEGVTREKRVKWPLDWSPGDPVPEGITIPEGTVFPEEWSFYLRFPTTKNLFLVSRSYDCNGIYLQTLPFARYNAPITRELLAHWLKLYEDMPLVEDARTPFLKGEKVTLDEGAIIPFGWKPNGRRVTGLHVPYGTIWPPDWKKGDAFPEWQCCPVPLLEQEREILQEQELLSADNVR